MLELNLKVMILLRNSIQKPYFSVRGSAGWIRSFTTQEVGANRSSLKSYKSVITNKMRISAKTSRKITANYLYSKLDSKDGKKNIYKFVKLKERKTRYFNQIKCIKSEDFRV